MKERYTYYIPKELDYELGKEALERNTPKSALLAAILDERYAARKKGLSQMTVELATAERTVEILRAQVKEMSRNTAEWEELRARFLNHKRKNSLSEFQKLQWLQQIKKEYPHIKHKKSEEILETLEGGTHA